MNRPKDEQTEHAQVAAAVSRVGARKNPSNVGARVREKRESLRPKQGKIGLSDKIDDTISGEMKSAHLPVDISEQFKSASSEARLAIIEILEADSKGRFKAAKIRLKSIYDRRRDGESIEDFVVRTYPGERPIYQSKRVSGDILEFIRNTYRDKGYVDGLHFTRFVLGRIDPAANQALTNYLRDNDLPNDLSIPAKRGRAPALIEGLTDEEIRAAYAVMSNKR